MSYQIIVLLQLSSKLFCLNLSWLLTSVHLSGNPTSHHCILALLEIVDSTGCWYTGYKAKLISLPVYQETFCTKIAHCQPQKTTKDAVAVQVRDYSPTFCQELWLWTVCQTHLSLVQASMSSEPHFKLAVIKNKTRNILLTWQWLHQGAKNFTKWFPHATCSSKVSSDKSIKPSAITSVSWTDWKCKPIQVV